MKKRPPASPALIASGKRIHALIEMMLEEMQRGLDDPDRLTKPEWTRLFGSRQSMVGNVQKLVQALAAIPAEDNSAEGGQEGKRPLSLPEVALISAWMSNE
jgi:hypothetical protein